MVDRISPTTVILLMGRHLDFIEIKGVGGIPRKFFLKHEGVLITLYIMGFCKLKFDLTGGV